MTSRPTFAPKSGHLTPWLLGAILCYSADAQAQATYDPPTAQRPAPNVLLLLDQTRTTSIDTNSCGTAKCHVEGNCGGFSGEWDCNLWARGGTRVQLARRVLTGGYGWNTSVTGPDGLPADGLARTDGVMDTYNVRWGVAWYDGLGVRLAKTPSSDNIGAQQAVIQLNGAGGVPGAYNDNYNLPTDPGLHSFMEYPRSTSWGNHYSSGWSADSVGVWGYPWIFDAQWFTNYDHANPSVPGTYYPLGTNASAPNTNAPLPGIHEDGRLTKALQWVTRYWSGQAEVFTPPRSTVGYESWFFKPTLNPQDGLVANDNANVLNHTSSDPQGCRKNFTVVLSDSHGANPYDSFYENGCPVPAFQVPKPYTTYGGSTPDVGRGMYPTSFPLTGLPGPDLTGPLQPLATPARLGGLKPSYNTCFSSGQSAAQTTQLGGLGGTSKANQVFLIHFGADAPADEVADYGWDGVSGGSGPVTAYNGAPGGTPSIAAMTAAFNSIFTTIFAGTYVGAAPTITRAGNYMIETQFSISNCSVGGTQHCNVGRPGQLKWLPLDASGNVGTALWDAGAILTARLYSSRNLYTTPPTAAAGAPTDSTCGSAASAPCATTVTIGGASTFAQVDTALQLTQPISAPLSKGYANFIMGDPTATFYNGVMRGDANGTGVIDQPYKLADVANSRPVLVGAPPGVGENQPQWKAFVSRSISGGIGTTVAARDQVAYVGGNDGFLHAFLTGKVGTSVQGAGLNYVPVGTPCPVGISQTPGPAACDGRELWGYTPGLLQRNWPQIRGGHYYMVDGTPTVDDVLFTKNSGSPGAPCSSGSCGSSWEYRTVLVQCLGSGGPGCFALDVTNPWSPQLLWERTFACHTGLEPGCVLGKGTSTSQPVIAKVKKKVGTSVIPYYVALMGGGANETFGGVSKGTFIAVGLEDGQVYTSQNSSSIPHNSLGGTAVATAPLAGAPNCIDADGDGYTDTCYIASTNGSIWKVRIENGDPNAANTYTAGSSSHATTGGMQMVEFFNGAASDAANDPNLVATSRVLATNTTSGKLALYLTTGDPGDVNVATHQNYFFKVVDASPAADAIPSQAYSAIGGGGRWNLSRQLNACTVAPPALTAASGPGSFKLPFGEEVLFDGAIVSGAVTFTSYAPSANPCLIGNSFLYGIAYDTCNNGLSSAPGAAPSQQRVPAGSGLSTGVTVNYATGNLYSAVAGLGTVSQSKLSATSPPKFKYRMMKLWWREML